MPHDLRAFGRGHGAPRPGICCQHPQGRNSARYRPRGISRWRIDTPTFSARSRYPHGGKGIARPARGGFSSRNAAYARSSRLRRTTERRLKNTTVAAYGETGTHGVSVTIDGGETYQANRLLLTASAWLPGLLGSPLHKLFRITRYVLYWFEVTGRAERFDPKQCPTYIWLVDRPSLVYGFPFADGTLPGSSSPTRRTTARSIRTRSGATSPRRKFSTCTRHTWSRSFPMSARAVFGRRSVSIRKSPKQGL